MDVTNSALLSALNDTDGANFYNEIYFPIIRYALTMQMNDDKSKDGYSTADSLKDVVKREFGLSIPLSVIRGAVRRIAESDPELTVYENGGSFKIGARWKGEDTSEIGKRRSDLENDMNAIEAQFKEYLTAERIGCKYTFTEFFSTHTSELLKYLNDGKEDKAPDAADGDTDDQEADLANLMRFITVLQKDNPELYASAETFFWSSIVAAFLQRDQNKLQQKKNRVVYYFDTSLVMSLLDLSDKDSATNARELKQMIEQSGHRVCVHPMTIREARNILTTSAQNATPDPASRISDAFVRRKLKNSDLLRFASTLDTDLDKIGVSIFKANKYELDKEEQKYDKDKRVAKLAAERNRGQRSHADFREIHDIYMCDFIRDERKRHKPVASAGDEQELAYFVTANKQLIDFCYIPSMAADQPMIHPGRIVANLWINGATNRDLRRSGLSEMVSRCLSANKIKAHRRIDVLRGYVAEYIHDKDEREEFCRTLYKQVVRQSNKITPIVDDILTDWKADKEEDAASETGRERFDSFRKAVLEEDEILRNAAFELIRKQEEARREAERQERELEKQRKINALHRELTQVIEEIGKLTTSKTEFEADRDKKVTDGRYHREVAVSIICVAVIIAYLAIAICTNWSEGLKAILAAVPIAAVIALCTFANSLPLVKGGRKRELRRIQTQNWMEDNPGYAVTCKSIESLSAQKSQIERELRTLNDN